MTDWSGENTIETSWKYSQTQANQYSDGSFNLSGRNFNETGIKFNRYVSYQNRSLIFTSPTQIETAWV